LDPDPSIVPPDASRRQAGERGSQTVELALLLPVLALLVALVLQGGMAAGDLVLAQTAAREAARAAAVDDDVAARDAARRVAGSREISVRVDPPDTQRVAGEPVTVEVELHSEAFARIGVPLRLPARAVMRTELP
jgi:hypothetical protein